MSSFNFSKEPPPDDMVSTLQKTNKLSEEQYSSLLDILFSFLTGSITTEALETKLEEYADSYGIKLNPLKNMTKVLMVVGNAMVKKNLSLLQIESDLKKMDISEPHIKLYCEKWKENISKLQKSLLVSSIRGRKMIDFDWKFGVTASSSELQKVGSCFIQMKFTVEDENRKREDVVTELSLPQFYDFMHEVERARISLESLG